MKATNQHVVDALAIMDSDSKVAHIAAFIRTLDVGFADFEQDQDSIAAYNPQTNLIWVNTMYPCDVEELAATLVHEGTHALDHKFDPVYFDTARLATEINAYTAMAEYWERRFPDGRHISNDDDEQSLNEWVRLSHTGQLKQRVKDIEGMRGLSSLFNLG